MKQEQEIMEAYEDGYRVGFEQVAGWPATEEEVSRINGADLPREQRAAPADALPKLPKLQREALAEMFGGGASEQRWLQLTGVADTEEAKAVGESIIAVCSQIQEEQAQLTELVELGGTTMETHFDQHATHMRWLVATVGTDKCHEFRVNQAEWRFLILRVAVMAYRELKGEE